VVAEDLVKLDEVLPVLLEPGCEPLVEVGPSRFRQGVVGGITDEEVAEAVRVVAGQLSAVGPNELLTDERDEPLVDGSVAVGERSDRSAVKGASLDGTALEHRALGRVELVEARREEGLDRRRHLHLGAARVAEEPDHLFEEKWVALRYLEDPLS